MSEANILARKRLCRYFVASLSELEKTSKRRGNRRVRFEGNRSSASAFDIYRMKKEAHVFVKRDMVTGVVLLGVAGVILAGVRRLPITQKGSGFGPGTFPLIVGIGLALLAAFSLLRSFYSKPHHHLDMPKERTTTQIGPLAILLATAGYISLISLLGFLASSIMFVFVITRIFKERSYVTSILYAVVFTSLVYLCFTYLLKTDLPACSLWES